MKPIYYCLLTITANYRFLSSHLTCCHLWELWLIIIFLKLICEKTSGCTSKNSKHGLWGIVLPSIFIYCSRGCTLRFLSYDQKTFILFLKCKLWCYKQFWKKNLQAKLKKKLRIFLVKVVTISSLWGTRLIWRYVE